MALTVNALPRPATIPVNEIVDALTTIRRKAGFLGAVLGSEIDLTDEGDLHELVCLTEQIYSAAEEVLAQLVPEKEDA